MSCTDDCCADKEQELARLGRHTAQRRVLQAALAINIVMFAIELVAGVRAGSAGLVADSVDMFGDATVYALSIYALERTPRWRAGAALSKAGIVWLFGLWVAFQVGWRLLEGGTPAAETIGVVGTVALLANVACLGLLWRFRSHDVNMSSTFECSRNDVMANGGVILAAAGVAVTNQAWPDLVIGGLIAAFFLRSGWRIAHAAWPELFGRDEPRERTSRARIALRR